MKTATDNTSFTIRRASVWLGWLAFGCFAIARYVATAIGQGTAINWRRGVIYEFVFVSVWALCTPLVFRWTQRVPLMDWGRTSLRHTPFAVVTACLQLGVFSSLLLLLEGPRGLPSWRREAIYMGCTNLAIYAVLATLYYSLRQRHERQAREAHLTARLAQAELQNLKMQLQPHFLFNTLHAIGVLMMRDVGAARRMLVRLSELLRLTLDHQATQEVALKEELEFLAAYLEIEHSRFQDKLTVQMEIADDVLNAAVPSLLLQPLVENAIRHGIARRAEAGVVVISAAQQNGNLYLQVRDNGPGMEHEAQPGIGLATTRARLEQLYGAAQHLEITRAAEGGVCVNVALPLRCADRG